jgi:hypothetical protein
MTEAKAFRTFIRIYSLFQSELLRANIKLNLHKTLIRSVLTYVCPAWELVAESYLLKWQCIQNNVLHTIENFPSCTLVHDSYTAFNLSYVYDYLTKLCRQQADIIRNLENEIVRGTEGEARHRKYKRLKLGGGQAYDRSSD